jgi:hypothetical protein
MNQILDYNPNKSSGGKTSGSDKVVRVFAVILIIFAVCLLGSGAYGLYKKNSQENVATTDAPTQAKITVEKSDTTATIKVSHDKAIEKLIYTWDSGKDTINKGNGESTMELEITLPAGEHVLTIKVTDIDGVETSYEETIISENGEDTTKPEISVSNQLSGTKLPVTVTDDTALDYVTYRWNDEEETRIDADEDDPKTIEFEVEILKGQNNLTIIAVDKNNNTTTKTQSYTGVTKPEITITINADKTGFSVLCYHEAGLKSIVLTLNGADYPVQFPEENATEVSFDYTLAEGNNTIKVTAVSLEGTETVATEEVDASSEETDTNIEIKIEKEEDVADKAMATITTTNSIKEITANINGVDCGVTNVAGQTYVTIEVQLEEGTNKIKFTVVTEDGTEKTEEAEIVRD